MKITCNICKTEFNAKRADAKYCSPKCRTQAHRNRIDAEKPKRRRIPLIDSFSYAAWPIERKTESLLRLIEDDRFKRNQKDIASRYLHPLKFARDRLDKVITALEQ